MSSSAAPVAVRKDVQVIGLVGLAHGTSHFFHLMLPPLFPWLMKDFSLSYTEAGMLMTVFFVVSGVGQALAGFQMPVQVVERDQPHRHHDALRAAGGCDDEGQHCERGGQARVPAVHAISRFGRALWPGVAPALLHWS